MKKANVTTAMEIQNIESVFTPCSEAATGRKSGLECKNDHTPAIVPNSQNSKNPKALVLLCESRAESDSFSPLRFLLSFKLLLITVIAKMKNTTDKRPTR